MKTTKIAYNPNTGRAEFRFVEAAGKEVASSEYSDHANRFPGGTARALFRTARGRYVWFNYSQWQGDPFLRITAATGTDGKPFDAADVESFIDRFGDDDDLEQWREDIAEPLPLA